MTTLTTFTQRRIIREELNRRVRLYIENCSCAGPQPDFDDLKLDQHQPYCRFVTIMEGDMNAKISRTA